MSDVVLDDDRNWVRVEGNVLQSQTSDFMLDNPGRRGQGGGRWRRALVHDGGDGLTVNFNGDYPGGVTVVDARVNLHVEEHAGGEPRLPKNATPGDLRLVVTTQSLNGQPIGSESTLWVCVPSVGLAALGATWRQVALGPEVHGNV